jgi:DNA polymerase IV
VEPYILHADMDAFYASVEQRERPELRGKPVIVGAASARGVVAAASYEARAFGVRSAMPGFQARQLCPHAVFVAGRMDLYAQVSAEVREVFGEFTDCIEPLALDEAFLDITGSVHLFGTALELGAELKRRVLARTRLNISVGIGPNKLLAKLACTLNKPNGLAYVPRSEVEGWLRPLPVRRLWGVGPSTEGRLLELGLDTLGSVMDAPEVLLRQAFGARAEAFRQRAKGNDPSAVRSERQAKSIGEENTFETDILADDVVSAALTAHSETVGYRLRAAGYKARTVTLKIKFGIAKGRRPTRVRVGEGNEGEPVYPVITRSVTLPRATSDATELRDAVWALWSEEGVQEPVRLLGVTASNLIDATLGEQLDLFAVTRRPGVGDAMDEIVRKFGKGAIRRAVDTPEKVTIAISKRPDRELPESPKRRRS